jgi:ornithine carbamoyltransferase
MSISPTSAAAHPQGPSDREDPGAAEVERARAAATNTVFHLPLASRNVGILCADPEQPAALLLQRIARELGARTALVRPDLDDMAEPSSVEHAARLLDLLYDVVICLDLPHRSVELLRSCARIPVVSDLRFPEAILVDEELDADVGAALRGQILERLSGTQA